MNILFIRCAVCSVVRKSVSWLMSLLLCSLSVVCLAQQAEGKEVILGTDTDNKVTDKKIVTEDDLIRLESTFIGDKEQPSVSYFIPWKGTDSPDDLKWKIERKNDDTLNLVDRDIMLRSMNIYNEMQLEK